MLKLVAVGISPSVHVRVAPTDRGPHQPGPLSHQQAGRLGPVLQVFHCPAGLPHPHRGSEPPSRLLEQFHFYVAQVRRPLHFVPAARAARRADNRASTLQRQPGAAGRALPYPASAVDLGHRLRERPGGYGRRGLALHLLVVVTQVVAVIGDAPAAGCMRDWTGVRPGNPAK